MRKGGCATEQRFSPKYLIFAKNGQRRATVVMVSSGCALLERLYKPFVREIYTKVYGTNVVRKNGETIRKSTSHIVVVSSPAGQEET
jgi:hypothetical protein